MSAGKSHTQGAVAKLVYGLIGAACSAVCFIGYYPLVPAFFSGCCLEQEKNLFLYIGLFVGMGLCMPVGAVVKYTFVLFTTSIGIHFYRWANRRCNGLTAGIIAGVSTAVMNCSGAALSAAQGGEYLLGLCEGLLVMGGSVFFHYLIQMSLEMGKIVFSRKDTMDPEVQEQIFQNETQSRIQAFAEAVDGLSAAFAASGSRESLSGKESVTALEKEVMGKLCVNCSACAICWDRRRELPDKIRQMLQAVVRHSSREEILDRNYMEECPKYPRLVEEAIRAFSRMELNEAWYRRLRENRLVIASQLDVMASAMQEWDKEKKNLDSQSRRLLARIGFEVRERGLVADHVHVYEDEYGRRSIYALVGTKWGGGIPSRNYRQALEKASGLAIRLQRDARSILTREAVPITAYEDTCYYTLSGVASEAKDTSGINGDSFSMFELENGTYHICLSDGMGSGPSAERESDMVVDLMEKFMEAGFTGETAITMMNSAMVLKGENDSYSTLDYAEIDLYTGELEITKIGAAASFVRHGQKVESYSGKSLPAGADVRDSGEKVQARLTDGDFLVMVTDGVLEYLRVKNPEAKIAEMICEIETDNAESLARNLLEQIKRFTGGRVLDDMTIVVTGIWEK